MSKATTRKAPQKIAKQATKSAAPKLDPKLAAQMDAHDMLLFELWNKQEDLHPDLVCYVDKSGPAFLWMLKHPLVHCPFTANAVLNYYYLDAKARLEAAEAEGDWIAWVLAHERPYQMDALAKVAERLDDAEYWEFVAHVFTEVENLWQYRAEVRRLLTSPRPQRERMMTEEELAEFASMPELITVYRGFGKASCRQGWSWTTNRAKAVWFAARFAALDGVKPKVVSGAVSKSDVIAYFSRRDESEIVVDPKRVRLD